MRWREKLSEWERGIPQTFTQSQNTIAWETSKCGQQEIEQFQMQTYNLPLPIIPDITQFTNKFTGHINDSVIAFHNLSGDAILVVPTPPTRSDKNYANLTTFQATAPQNIKIMFWKKVAATIRVALRNWGTVYVSTHGAGVAWLHIRICKTPKYYQTSMAYL